MSGTTVVLLRSTDTGAPVLNGVAGSCIAVLDACLQDGYNSKTNPVITRVGTTVTVTYATAHGYAADGLSKIEVSGCVETAYNGIFTPFNVTTLTFDYTITGTPNSPATGTRITKVAPLGWSKTYTGTNKGVYRGNEVTGTRLYLRVDDTTDSGKSAGMRGYEAMTDVDTGTGLFPTVLQMATGIVLTKSDTASSAARPWVLVGDGYEFLLFTAGFAVSYANIYGTFHFGDPLSEMASDPYGCLIYGGIVLESYPGSSGFAYNQIGTSLTAQAGHYFARSYTQIGPSIGAEKMGNYSLGGTTIGLSGILTYPAPSNNGLYIAPLFVADAVCLRAQLKPVWQPLHVRPLGHGILIAANVSPISRRLYSVTTNYSQSTAGETHIDIDGPWR